MPRKYIKASKKKHSQNCHMCTTQHAYRLLHLPNTLASTGFTAGQKGSTAHNPPDACVTCLICCMSSMLGLLGLMPSAMPRATRNAPGRVSKRGRSMAYKSLLGVSSRWSVIGGTQKHKVWWERYSRSFPVIMKRVPAGDVIVGVCKLHSTFLCDKFWPPVCVCACVCVAGGGLHVMGAITCDIIICVVH